MVRTCLQLYDIRAVAHDTFGAGPPKVACCCAADSAHVTLEGSQRPEDVQRSGPLTRSNVGRQHWQSDRLQHFEALLCDLLPLAQRGVHQWLQLSKNTPSKLSSSKTERMLASFVAL